MLGFAVLIYWSYRHMTISTADNSSAFLQTKFGMSPFQVQKIMEKNSIQLVDRKTFKSLDPEGSRIILFFEQSKFVFAEDELKRDETELWFLPSFEMFGSKVSAEFAFDKKKLISVYLVFIPLNNNNAADVVENLIEKINYVYQQVGKEASKEVLGAYRIKFRKKSSSATLWVNLTDKNKPIITLGLTYDNALANQRISFVKMREETAFN